MEAVKTLSYLKSLNCFQFLKVIDFLVLQTVVFKVPFLQGPTIGGSHFYMAHGLYGYFL